MAVNMKKCKNISIGCAVAELVGMFLFVLCGAGTAMSIPHTAGWTLQVSLAFGLAITVLAYSLGHHSGAQFNCAVTWGLVLAGKLGAPQGILNAIAQSVGAIFAGFVATWIIPQANDQTFGVATVIGNITTPAGGPGVACNGLGANVTTGNAFAGEVVFTCLLVLAVLETAVSKKSGGNRTLAALAIGLAVFLGHSVLIPVDGCSINPTRSLGTAVAAAAAKPANSPFDNFWVFVLGPIVGSSLAVVIYHGLRKLDSQKDSAWLVDDDKEALTQDSDEE